MSIVVTALHCPTGKRYEFCIAGDDAVSIAKDLCARLRRLDADDIPSDWVDVKIGVANNIVVQPSAASPKWAGPEDGRN